MFCPSGDKNCPGKETLAYPWGRVARSRTARTAGQGNARDNFSVQDVLFFARRAINQKGALPMQLIVKGFDINNAHWDWTDSEQEQLVTRAQSLYAIDQIAEFLGRTPSAVYSRLCKVCDQKAWPPPVRFDLMTFGRALMARLLQDDYDRARKHCRWDYIEERKKERTRYHTALRAGDLQLLDQMRRNEPLPTQGVHPPGIYRH